MIRRFGKRVSAVLAVTVTCLLPVSTAQGASDEPMVFEPADLVVLSGADGSVVLVSNLPDDATVKLRLRFPKPLVGTDGEPVEVRSRVFVPRQIVLPADQSVTIPILVGDLAGIAPESTVDGQLRAIATVDDVRTVVSVRLRLEVTAESEPSAVVPDVEAWTVVRTDRLGTDSLDGGLLPVTADAGSTLPVRLGVLQDGSGNDVTVTGTLVEPEDGGSPSEVQLGFRDFESGTSYTGTIDLDPTSEEGAVTMTVRSTDPVGWAILVLVMGIAAGLLATWLAAIGWPLRRLREDGRAAAAKVRGLVSPTGGTPGASGTWALGSDATDLEAQVEQRVKKLRFTSFGRLDRSRPEYVAASEAVAALEAAGAAWDTDSRAVHDALPGLVDALDNVQPTLSEPEGAEEKPSIIAATRKHLAPRDVSVEDLPGFVTTTAWLSSTVIGFVDLWRTSGTRHAFLSAIARSTAPWKFRTMARDALLELDAARWHLWHATSKDDLDSGKVTERFAAVDDVVAQLRGVEGIKAPPASVRAALTRENPNARSGDLAVLLPTAVVSTVNATAKPILATFQGLVRAGHGALVLSVVLIGVVIGVRTGLGELYDDKGFGTLSDYIGAFVWGFAAATVIGAVTGTLDAFFGRRLAAEEEAAESA